MKKIFLLSAILFALHSFAQESYYDFKKFKEKNKGDMTSPPDKNKSKGPFEYLLKRLNYKPFSGNIQDLSFVQRDGNQVHILPQDNMPCLVPDLSKTNYNMPILMKGKKITGMPPGSAPNHDLLIPKTYKKQLQ